MQRNTRRNGNEQKPKLICVVHFFFKNFVGPLCTFAVFSEQNISYSFVSSLVPLKISYCFNAMENANSKCTTKIVKMPLGIGCVHARLEMSSFFECTQRIQDFMAFIIQVCIFSTVICVYRYLPLFQVMLHVCTVYTSPLNVMSIRYRSLFFGMECGTKLKKRMYQNITAVNC